MVRIASTQTSCRGDAIYIVGYRITVTYLKVVILRHKINRQAGTKI
jgi:hypothetical protein